MDAVDFIIVPLSYPHLVFGDYWYPIGAGNGRMTSEGLFVLCYTGWVDPVAANDAWFGIVG